MTCTARFAHLSEISNLHIGSRIKRGDIIGKMGSTGQSTAIHLHLDNVWGLQAGRYSLVDIASGRKESAPEQLNYFIDKELFGIEPVITTYYNDYRYQLLFNKLHPGYDLVPEDRHKTEKHYYIHWNRSKDGNVSAIFNDTTGYGLHILISYEV